MTSEIKKDTRKLATEAKSFMFPIWVITIVSMLGTSLASYAYHGYDLNKRHNQNVSEIDSIKARTIKYTEYRDILIKGGKAAGAEYLNNK